MANFFDQQFTGILNRNNMDPADLKGMASISTIFTYEGPDGKTKTLEADLGDDVTIKLLKTDLKDHFGEAETQRWYYKGKEMDDNHIVKFNDFGGEGGEDDTPVQILVKYCKPE